MDPLTLTTAIVTLVQACASLSKTVAKVVRLKDAAGLVQAVNNEVSDLHLVSMHVEEYFEKARNTESVIPAIDRPMFDLYSSTLDQARHKVREVEALVNEKLLSKSSKTAELKISRTAIYRNSNRLNELRRDLRDTRQNIANLFSNLGVRDISRIGVQINEIRSTELQSLSQRQDRVEEMLHHIEDRQLTMAHTVPRAPEDARPHSQDGSQPSNIQISISPLSTQTKQPTCSCRRQRASINLRTFLGSLFLGYTSTPIADTHGNACLCRRQSQLYLTYSFPSWFIRYLFSVQLGFDNAGTIACSISLIQTISSNHIIWDYVEFGNLEGIKRLLGSGQVSLEAQNPSNQRLIHHAIYIGNIPSTKFLVKVGADVLSDTATVTSPQKTVWHRILGCARTSQWRDEMKSLFPEPDFDELYEFNLLHKAVIGLSSCSVESILDAEPNLIDQTDISGKTALSWAAWHGDNEAVQAILKYGPDVNKADKVGNSAFHLAIKAGTAGVNSGRECMDLLLTAGSDPHFRNKNLLTSLHIAVQTLASEVQDTTIVDSLLQAGVDVNATDNEGETALFMTTYENKVKPAEYLICHGADAGICNIYGGNVLCNALRRNCHSLLDLLLRERQDHTGWLEEEGTFIHLAAHSADTKSLRRLSQANLKRRDINVKDRAGLAPFQVAMHRENVDAEWREAFFDFLRSIDEDQPLPPERLSEMREISHGTIGLGAGDFDTSTSSSESDDTDKDFEDAVEIQT